MATFQTIQTRSGRPMSEKRSGMCLRSTFWLSFEAMFEMALLVMSPYVCWCVCLFSRFSVCVCVCVCLSLGSKQMCIRSNEVDMKCTCSCCMCMCVSVCLYAFVLRRRSIWWTTPASALLSPSAPGMAPCTTQDADRFSVLITTNSETWQEEKHS